MQSNEEIKQVVRDKYAQIVTEAEEKEKSCCCCGKDEFDYSIMSDQYDHLDGYVADANLNLGCGLPTEYAGMKPGDTVVDLGSGAGNDVFIARKIVGPEGRVVGIDFTQEMIDKAERNKLSLGFENVEFKQGEIENLPIEDDFANVIISNCVLNLVPDKATAFSEIYRTLKPGGHFCISDIVLKGELPEKLREPAEMYAGCISGALQQDKYIEHINLAGFNAVEIKKSKTIVVPDELLNNYLSDEEIKQINNGDFGIYSITVVGSKS